MDLIFYQKSESSFLIPLVYETIHAGFESPAADYEEDRIDLNAYVSKNPLSTFYVKVIGDCMVGSGIYEGDLLVVDKSVNYKNGDIVVGFLNGDFILRVYLRNGVEEYLMPDNEKYQPIKRSEACNFQVWGVVLYTIHHHQNQQNVRINRLQQLLRVL